MYANIFTRYFCYGHSIRNEQQSSLWCLPYCTNTLTKLYCKSIKTNTKVNLRPQRTKAACAISVHAFVSFHVMTQNFPHEITLPISVHKDQSSQGIKLSWRTEYFSTWNIIQTIQEHMVMQQAYILLFIFLFKPEYSIISSHLRMASHVKVLWSTICSWVLPSKWERIYVFGFIWHIGKRQLPIF